MANSIGGLIAEVVKLRVILTSVVAAVAGILLLGVSEWFASQLGPASSSVARSIGGFLVGTFVLAFAWELWARRAFLAEVLEKARIASDVHNAGIVQIVPSYLDVDWKTHLRGARSLDVFFTYGRTWRSNYLQELNEIAARKDGAIRVVLPDPEDELTLDELARRFGTDTKDVKGRITEAKAEIENLRRSGGARVEVWYWPGTMQLTFYLLDNVGVIAFYSHRRIRMPVPAFVCSEGGSLYAYARAEFEHIINAPGLSRKVVG
jgi:hypothetical protein